MKRLIYPLILILLLTACSPASAEAIKQAANPTTPEIIQPVPSSTMQPNTPATPGPTDLFITQVMATKYAAQTEYAALPTITPTPTIPPGSPDCHPPDLKTTIATNGATGRIVLEVGVTNIGASPCFLPSWPQIELLDHIGKPIDIVYDYIYPNANPTYLPPTQESNPGEPIVYGMEMKQTAGLALLWGNWCGGPIEGGVTIRMSLLGTAGLVDIPTNIGGGGYCDDPSSPSTIDIIVFGY